MLLKSASNNQSVRQVIATLTKSETTTNSCLLPSTSYNINDFNASTPNHFLFEISLNIQGTDQSNSKDIDSRQSKK